MRNVYRAKEAEKRPGKTSCFRFFVLLCLILYPSSFILSAYAAISQTVNYQGFLVSKITNAAVDSPQDMKFVIYAAPSGGSALFTESRCNVAVSRGRYDVEIGSATSGGIPADVFLNSGLWLEIQVDADGDCSGQYEAMQPRVRLQSSPFAFNSLYASTAAAGPGFAEGSNPQNELTPHFKVDIIGTQDQSTYGAVTISSNLYVQGGISVGAISPGSQLSVSGMVESQGPCENLSENNCACKDSNTCGFKFPDGSSQYTAAANTMWAFSNEGLDLYNITLGNVGISTSTPQARLHVSTGAAQPGDVFLVTAGTSTVFHVNGQGIAAAPSFSGDGSALQNVHDEDKVSKVRVNQRMVGSLTISSSAFNTTAGSSLTVTDALGISAKKIQFVPYSFVNKTAIVEISSVASSANFGGVPCSDPKYCPNMWAGIYVSSHIFISSMSKIIGDGSMIRGVVSEDSTKLYRSGDSMGGYLVVAGSSVTIITSNTVTAYSLAVTTDPAQQSWHFYLSTGGNLGIGTKTLTHKLRVEGGIMAVSSITAQGGLYTQGPLSANSITSVNALSASSATFTWAGVTAYSIETATSIWVHSGGVTANYFIGNGSGLTGVMGTDTGKVSKTGDTMTGPLQINGAITVTNSSVTIINTTGEGAYTLLVSTIADPDYYALVVTTGGYVGVHTAYPEANLDVHKELRISNLNMGDPASLAINTYAGLGYIHWKDDALFGNVNQGALGYALNSWDLVYRAAGFDPLNGGEEVFRIKSDVTGVWKFGIGTADPKASLHVNADMLVGAGMTAPILFVSTAASAVGIATTTVSHKLVVNGGILAYSSVTANAGFYGTFNGDLYTSSLTVFGNKGLGATPSLLKIGERDDSNTLSLGVNSDGVNFFDMVLSATGKVGIGVDNVPDGNVQLQTIKGIKIGSNSDTSGAVLILEPAGGDTYIRWSEGAVPNKGVLGFKNLKRDLIYKTGADTLDAGIEVWKVTENGGQIMQSSLTVTGLSGMSATGDLLNVGTGKFVVTNDGRVGFGILAPTYYGLDVNGSALIRSSVSITGSGLTGSQDVFQVATSIIDAKINGNVGIGTNSPDRRLDINGAAIVRSSFVVLASGLTGTQTVFSVLGSTLVVRADGIVGIGVDNPLAITDRLEVNGTVKASGFVAGWERVTNVCTPTIQTCSVSCSAGKKIMGGGCATTMGTNYIRNSYPSADDQWTCEVMNSLTGNNMTAYAICSTVQ